MTTITSVECTDGRSHAAPPLAAAVYSAVRSAAGLVGSVFSAG
jgi:hypothetical protein